MIKALYEQAKIRSSFNDTDAISKGNLEIGDALVRFVVPDADAAAAASKLSLVKLNKRLDVSYAADNDYSWITLEGFRKETTKGEFQIRDSCRLEETDSRNNRRARGYSEQS
ncbi:hypothetical protein M0804_008555 [Polistes exclamans]|nr:hypothetical protein M0804_008555 [Polistes exclamans]